MLRLKARGWGSRRIAVKLRCSPETVRRWLAQGEWRPYPSRSRPGKLDGLSDWLRERFRLHAGNTNAVRQELAREKNITVSLRTVERAVAPLWREFFLAERARQAAFEWMRSVLQKDINLDVLRREVGDVPDIETLLQRLYDGRLSDRNRSMIVLASRRGAKQPTSFAASSASTRRRTASTCGRSKMEAALRCSRARSGPHGSSTMRRSSRRFSGSCTSRPQTMASTARHGSCLT